MEEKINEERETQQEEMQEEVKQENIFEKLSKINVNGHTEDKNGLTYLSWVWAWSEIKKIYPDADYKILKFENNLPYVYDENTGYMVFTEMTIDNKSYEMWLPVMDGNNKAMLNRPYIYKVKEYVDGKFTGNYVEKEVLPATMFDINKTIMRCLVKNIAMFGLGIYIYAGEDLPDGYEMSIEEAEKIVLTFGKYKGKTLKEIKEADENYLYWLIDSENAKESLKSACSKLVKPVEQEDVDLLAEMEKLILTTNTDREKLYKNYKVNSNNEMTKEQIKDAIIVLEKKLKKGEINE